MLVRLVTVVILFQATLVAVHAQDTPSHRELSIWGGGEISIPMPIIPVTQALRLTLAKAGKVPDCHVHLNVRGGYWQQNFFGVDEGAFVSASAGGRVRRMEFAIGGGAFKEKSRAPFPWLVVAFGGVWEVQEGTLFRAGVGTNGIYMGLSGRVWTRELDIES